MQSLNTSASIQVPVKVCIEFICSHLPSSGIRLTVNKTELRIDNFGSPQYLLLFSNLSSLYL